MNILFVCTANISRSFFAEMLFKSEAKLNNLDHIAVSSAGTHAHEGTPPDPEMIQYLSEMDVPIESHQAKRVSKDLVDWADRILVMEKDHAEIIERQWPEAKKKLDLFGKYISDDYLVDDIIDPYGRSMFHYRLARSQISMAIRNLLKEYLPHKNAQNKDHSS
jgi:protein-tyrosine phosphatase